MNEVDWNGLDLTLLASLHWPPVKISIEFKILPTAFRHCTLWFQHTAISAGCLCSDAMLIIVVARVKKVGHLTNAVLKIYTDCTKKTTTCFEFKYSANNRSSLLTPLSYVAPPMSNVDTSCHCVYSQ